MCHFRLIFRRCKASWGFKADKHDTTARAQSKVGRILQVLVVAIAVVALGLTICAMAQVSVLWTLLGLWARLHPSDSVLGPARETQCDSPTGARRFACIPRSLPKS